MQITQHEVRLTVGTMVLGLLCTDLTGVTANSVSASDASEPIRLAVSPDFLWCSAQVKEDFETRTANVLDLRPITSVAKISSQPNEVKFDAVLGFGTVAMDYLDKQGKLDKVSRGVVEQGRLALVGNFEWREIAVTEAMLGDPASDPVAIADPAKSRYGRAALEVLDSLGLQRVRSKLLVVESDETAFQLALANKADLAFVPLGMIKLAKKEVWGPLSWWEIPKSTHAPLNHEVGAIHQSQAKESVTRFIASLLGEAVGDVPKVCGFESRN